MGGGGRVKQATHLAILYADRRDGQKSPGVHGAAIAIFAGRHDRRIYLASQISAIAFAGIRQEFPFLRFSTLIVANRW